MAVMYLYKVYEGQERAIIYFRFCKESENPGENDEIYNYRGARYDSACESCYWMFAFELHANLSHVVRLALHLGNKQTLTFKGSSDIYALLGDLKHSTLMGWFLANRKFPIAR